MAHAALDGGHARFARKVVQRTLVERSAGGAALSPEAAAAKAQTAWWNDTLSQDLNIALAVGVALLLLAFAPLAATWFANSRFRSGWRLRSSPTPSSSTVLEVDRKGEWEQSESENKRAMHAVVPITDRPLPLPIAPTTAFLAHFRTFYNRLLLPTSPFFSLTYGQVAVCLAYEAIVVFCLLYQATDQKANWKRSGCVSVAQMPALFLLAGKNNALSIFGKGYEKLNFLHRVAGRLVIFCGALHSILFLVQNPVNWQKPVHVSGVVAFVACLVLLLTSISYVRRAFYQFFLISHIAGWITFVVALQFHVPDFAQPYTVFVVVLYGCDLLCRLLKTRFGSATIVALPGGTTMLQSHGTNSGWRPGQHVWLRCVTGVGWRASETHPFTVANAPREKSTLDGSHNLTLLVKSTGDFTRKLNESATFDGSGGLNGKQIKVALEGPYGGPMFTDFSDAQSTLLVAGGSGITFAAPILEELVHLASRGELRTRQVVLVWAVKEVDCLTWYQEFLTGLIMTAREKTCLDVGAVLHVTHPPPSGLPRDSPIPFSRLVPGRPSPSRLLSHLVSDVLASVQRKGLARGGGVVVGTCGPRRMVDEVRGAVAGVEREKAVAVGGIVSYSETFGW